MQSFKFGDIVLLNFPFTDGKISKRRPALIINDFNDGDIIVCRITSQIYKTVHDVYIDDWAEAGLKLPSVIRVHKLATLEKNLFEKKLGAVNEATKNTVSAIISKLCD